MGTSKYSFFLSFPPFDCAQDRPFALSLSKGSERESRTFDFIGLLDPRFHGDDIFG